MFYCLLVRESRSLFFHETLFDFFYKTILNWFILLIDRTLTGATTLGQRGALGGVMVSKLE